MFVKQLKRNEMTGNQILFCSNIGVKNLKLPFDYILNILGIDDKWKMYLKEYILKSKNKTILFNNTLVQNCQMALCVNITSCDAYLPRDDIFSISIKDVLNLWSYDGEKQNRIEFFRCNDGGNSVKNYNTDEYLIRIIKSVNSHQ